MDYLKGYKPVDLNKGDFKKLDKFSEIDAKDSKIINEIIELLHDEEHKCEVFALREKKKKKYKSIYVFKSDKDENNNKILKFYRSVTLDDIATETRKTFEDIIFESLKESVSIDETWKKVIWNDNVIEPRVIRIGSINLSAGLFGMIFGILLYVITGEIMWFACGLCIGLGSGAIVSKLGEQKEEKEKSKDEDKLADKGCPENDKKESKEEKKARKIAEKESKKEQKRIAKEEKKRIKKKKDNKDE